MSDHNGNTAVVIAQYMSMLHSHMKGNAVVDIIETFLALPKSSFGFESVSMEAQTKVYFKERLTIKNLHSHHSKIPHFYS